MEQTPQTTIDTGPRKSGEALSVRRLFTKPGVHPFDEVEWEIRDALTAALERHRDGKCEEQQQQQEQDNADATPTATATPAPSTPAPAPVPAPPPPAQSPDSGSLPDFGSGGSTPDPGDSVDPIPEAPGEDAIPEGTPSPTPAPAATPTPEPRMIVTKAAASPNMFVPGALLAVALIGLLIAALSALVSKRSDRFAGVNQAWQEAAYRTSGTWSDFTDWLRSRR